jgi:hypothetical protein
MSAVAAIAGLLGSDATSGWSLVFAPLAAALAVGLWRVADRAPILRVIGVAIEAVAMTLVFMTGILVIALVWGGL